MCGINGIFDFAGRAGRTGVAADPALVRAMNAALSHRGPDDEGLYSDPERGVWLGHRRLSILDLSPRGHQPMLGPRGTAIVYNGEVYNFRELRAALARQSAARVGGASADEFNSGSDTEVIQRLWERDGARSLTGLNGMFAFAIWDPAADQLVLVRDRVGIKPLYYTTIGGIFAFSSEVKALLTLPWVRAELDELALHHFLTFNNLSAPDTMFRGIHKLPPAHTLTVSRKGPQNPVRYWQVGYDSAVTGTPAQQAEAVLSGLRNSVRLQMVSDAPVGAFLSGGVDSSAVVALMSEVSTAPVRTYTVGFDGVPGRDERVHADRIVRLFGTEHHERVVSKEEIVEFLPHIVDIYDEPLADATSIPIYFISEMARRDGTKVILTGDGADELFCGYRAWTRYARLDRWYRALVSLPAPLRRAAAAVAGSLAEGSIPHEMFSRAARGQEFFWGGAGGLKPSIKDSLLSSDFRRRTSAVDLHEYVVRCRQRFAAAAPPARHDDVVDWMVFVGITEIVPNYYMHRADRMGMAHSVELRVPYLDHHFVRQAVSIPSTDKIVDGEPKSILKKALEPLLPHETLYRPKQGFCVPLEEWMAETILTYLDQRVDAFCRDTGLFDPAGIRRLADRARRGDTSVVAGLWNLFFLMRWFDRWMLGR